MKIETKSEKAKLNKRRQKRMNVFAIIMSIFISSFLFIITRSWIIWIISLIGIFILFFLYIYFRNFLKKSARIKRMEEVFPDFLQLVASNLRAGITIDRSMLLSSREEFSPLDNEIFQTGKDIATGKEIETALLDMAKRIGSQKIEKIILLLVSGIKAGGNLAVLLEDTSVSMREGNFVEKRAASNVLMYVIFIFFAVSVGAPALFSLSNILVETLTNLLSGIPVSEVPVNLPFTLSKVNISIDFIKYFSIVFIIVIDILASLVLGLVRKGEEREGLRYLPFILVISLLIFFLIRVFLSGFISGLFG